MSYFEYIMQILQTTYPHISKLPSYDKTITQTKYCWFLLLKRHNWYNILKYVDILFSEVFL